MDGTNGFLLLLWGGVVWAQDALNGAEATNTIAQDVLAYQDPLLGLLANGGITLPTSLVVVAFIMANKISAAIKDWSPTININLTEPIRVRLMDPRRVDE